MYYSESYNERDGTLKMLLEKSLRKKQFIELEAELREPIYDGDEPCS